MSTSAKTPVVVFGPFIGEFGWELLYWHGVVRRLCRTDFRNHHRVAVSLAGRGPFYPDVDEFVAIKSSDLPSGYSPRSYITDGWRDGLPGEDRQFHALHPINIWASLRHKRITRASYIERWRGPSVEPYVKDLMTRLVAQFPPNTTFFSPFVIHNLDEGQFGCDVSVPSTALANASRKPSFGSQFLTRLTASHEASRQISQLLDSDKPYISVFPRSRPFRRTDKNWSREQYVELIRLIRNRGFNVALLGAPNGAYFADESYPDCLDLINISDENRLDLHLAMVTKSVLAIGAMSGSLLVALAAGCPAIIFGDEGQQLQYYRENYLDSPLMYVSTLQPSASDLMRVTESMLNAICKNVSPILRAREDSNFQPSDP